MGWGRSLGLALKGLGDFGSMFNFMPKEQAQPVQPNLAGLAGGMSGASGNPLEKVMGMVGQSSTQANPFMDFIAPKIASTKNYDVRFSRPSDRDMLLKAMYGGDNSLDTMMTYLRMARLMQQLGKGSGGGGSRHGGRGSDGPIDLTQLEKLNGM